MKSAGLASWLPVWQLCGSGHGSSASLMRHCSGVGRGVASSDEETEAQEGGERSQGACHVHVPSDPPAESRALRSPCYGRGNQDSVSTGMQGREELRWESPAVFRSVPWPDLGQEGRKVWNLGALGVDLEGLPPPSFFLYPEAVEEISVGEAGFSPRTPRL